MRYIFGIFILAFCCDAKYIPEDGVYSVAEEMPEYEAGMKVFATHIDSFVKTCEYQQNGDVFVSFVVKTDGQLDDFRVVRSVAHPNDSLAIYAIKSAPMKWKPGIDDGQPVEVEMVYSVEF